MDKQQRDFLNKMAKEYGITKEDTFSHKHYTIITRAGIEKISAKANIVIKYNLEEVGGAGVIIKAIGDKDGRVIETYGSASKDTSQSKYYVEMAEKRAMSRVVLKLINAYELGFMGEDEADDFVRQEK
jgi:hypothetical protein